MWHAEEAGCCADLYRGFCKKLYLSLSTMHARDTYRGSFKSTLVLPQYSSAASIDRFDVFPDNVWTQ